MRKRTREILAVVLLAVFAVIGVSAMAWYILVGHSWNVAATNIDDSIGQMNGYSVILYEGTQPLEADEDVEKVSLLDAESTYLDKGATVFSVRVGEPARYAEPILVAKRGTKIGIFAAGKAEKRSSIRAKARELSLAGANYIVAVTDDAALGQAAREGLIGKVSIAICSDDAGRGDDGRYQGATFCVNAPREGEVGAVVISPSGVISSKTVDASSKGERNGRDGSEAGSEIAAGDPSEGGVR